MCDKEEEQITAAKTVTAEDFQALVALRSAGKAGFHLNVDQSHRFFPPPEEAVLDWAALSHEEKSRLADRQAALLRGGKIGMIVMAGGEATRFGGPKTFVSITPSLGEFLQVKVKNLKWLQHKYQVTPPLYILSSEKRIVEFQQQLRERNFYGLDKALLRWYVQGTVDTFIPSDAECHANYNAVEREQYQAFIMAMRAANPDGVYRFKGTPRLVPAGHFDAIASFIISGQLTHALKQGLEYAAIVNIDNLQAIVKDDGMIAAFADSGEDVCFILAEKNITYEITDKASGKIIVPKVLVRYRDNVLSFDGTTEFSQEAEQQGWRVVIDRDRRTVQVFARTGQPVEVLLRAKAETGGTLVSYKDEQGQTVVTMKEGFELPADFDHQQASFFNTNTMILRLRSLLRLLGVTQEALAQMAFTERSALVRTRLVQAVKANFEFKNHEVSGEFPNLGIVKEGRTLIPVVQMTRIMLQMTQIKGVRCRYLLAPRKEVFAPVKEPEDKETAARNNENLLIPYLLA